MVKVFFNNSCNICRAEISHYKKHGNDNVEWIDVTNNEEAQKITSKSKAIIVVGIYGLPPDLDKIIEIAKEGYLVLNKKKLKK